MILNDKIIRLSIENGMLIKNPINIDESLQPASYDITLGNRFLIPTYNDDTTISGIPVVDTKKEMRYNEIIVKDEEGFVIPANGFVLGVTNEYMVIPTDVTGFVEGRSSIGRTGLFIQNAGLLDAGFEGTITLELFNGSSYPLIIYPNMRIGQVVFIKNIDKAKNPYKGKYQGQVEVTGSKINKDFR